MIYITVFIIITIAIITYDIANFKKKQIESFYFITIILCLISTFSYRIGADTANYYINEFEHDIVCLNNLSHSYLFNTQSRQFGWQLFGAIIKTYFPSFTFFKAIHSFIINFTIGTFILKYFKYKFTALLCYCFFLYIPFNFEILRESLAVSFFLISIPYFLKRNFIIFYTFIFISLSFHISAFVLLPLPLLLLLTKSRLFLKLIPVICIISLFFIDEIKQMFYYLTVIDSISDKAEHYFASDTYGISRFSLY